jgi:hypothetical protein
MEKKNDVMKVNEMIQKKMTTTTTSFIKMSTTTMNSFYKQNSAMVEVSPYE